MGEQSLHIFRAAHLYRPRAQQKQPLKGRVVWLAFVGRNFAEEKWGAKALKGLDKNGVRREKEGPIMYPEDNQFLA